MNLIIDWIIMFSLAALGPVFFFVFRGRLLKKERENQAAIIKATFDAEERQKLIIANNLHDEILPNLSLIVQNVDLNMIDFNNGRFDINKISDDKEIALSSMEAIRTIALDLTPKVLIDLGLISALQSFISKLRSSKFTAKFENNSNYEEKLPFNKSEEINIYRASLEIIKNIQKHDEFTELKVEVKNYANLFILSFRHNGVGISDKEIKNKTENSYGLGLRSLTSRLILLNGKINYTQDSEGALVEFKIPFKK